MGKNIKDLDEIVSSVQVINPPNGFLAWNENGEEYCTDCGSYNVSRCGLVEDCSYCGQNRS